GQGCYIGMAFLFFFSIFRATARVRGEASHSAILSLSMHELRSSTCGAGRRKSALALLAFLWEEWQQFFEAEGLPPTPWYLKRCMRLSMTRLQIVLSCALEPSESSWDQCSLGT